MGETAQVRIDLLGAFVVRVGDRSIPVTQWPSRRSAELVALLALAERQMLLREVVIEALWPHLDPDAGAANLRKAAHHARSALGCEDAVVLAGGRVTLFPDRELHVDVAQFEQQAAAALADGSPAACRRAAAAYTGDLLPEARYEAWTEPRRAHLRLRQVALLRRAGEWERLLELDATDESAFRGLMHAELAAGNRHAAIRWYARLRAVLQDTLGVAPSPESRALYDESVAGLAPAVGIFRGRAVELARAVAALRSAGAGELGALLVRGPAGIGKSMLCREIATEATALGWRAVTVSASAGCAAYAPLIEAVEAVLTVDRRPLEGLSEQVRSTLAALTPLAAPAPPPVAGLSRHMIFGAVHRLLMSVPDAAGVLLVVDDLHLADEGTAEACIQLARARGALPLLVIASYRNEPARPTLVTGVAGLERAGLAAVVDVPPMDPPDLAALVREVAPTSAPVLDEVLALAGGNPFFAVELARAADIGTNLSVPQTVWDAVTARCCELDDSQVAMLRRLAVVDHGLDPAGVLAMTGLDEPDGFAFLDAALAAGALVVAGARYRFRHDLVRVALAAQVAPHERLAIHRDAARRLAAAGAEPASIARHWLAGEQLPEAAPWLLEAARRAVKVGAFGEALRHLDTLVEHDPCHAEALFLRAQALEALGDLRAAAAYEAAAQAASGNEADNIRAMRALAQVKQGDPPGGVATLQGLRPTSLDGKLAEALAWAGAALLGFAQHDLGTAKAAESRRLALQSGDHARLVIASWAQAGAAHARGELRDSVWADLLDTAALPDLAVSAFDGHLCISQRLLYGTAPYPDVIAFADAFESEAVRLGAARGRAYAITLRGQAELLHGRLDAAESDLRLATRLSRDVAAAVSESFSMQLTAELALHRGRAAESRAMLDDALAVARESNVGFHLLDRIYGAKITAAKDPDAALAVLEDAESSVQGPLETCPGCRIALAVPAAIAASRAGDTARMEQWVAAVDMLADVVMKLPAWYAARDEVRGHVAQTHGAPAAGHFSAAAAGFAAVGQPLDEARCRAQATAAI